jgi:multidrug efflux pump subunit AcrB
VIAALLPMAFVTGLMGPYMSPIPINSSLGMLISLAIAFVVTPWLALRLTGTQHAPPARRRGQDATGKRPMVSSAGDVAVPARRPGGRKRGPAVSGSSRSSRASVSLAVVQLVVLKMLPFDNKSEFQVVVDMPEGTPLEDTARVLREMGAQLAKVPEVTDYQAYAGTAAPINFNGLVRQYYLRRAASRATCRSTWSTSTARERQSHEIAVSGAPALTAIARARRNVKVVEVPPGPPVLSPIVAEVYGPDYDGQVVVAKQVRAAVRADTADIVGIDDIRWTRTRRSACCVSISRQGGALGVAAGRHRARCVRLG